MSQPAATDTARPRPHITIWRRASAVAGALGPLLALVLVIAFFIVAEWLQPGPDVFCTPNNARTIAVQALPVIVAALGMTVIIIAGGIDLAAGTALALSATVLAWCLDRGYAGSVAVVAGIATGLLAGLVNGALVAMLRVVPFIVTLGTMTIYLGLGKLIAHETTVRPPLAQIPSWFDRLVTTHPQPEWLISPHALPGVAAGVPNVALGAWIAVALAVVLSAVLRYTVFGRYVFALGSNELTARLCGINVPLVKIAVYALGGLFIGVAGCYQFARLSSGNPTSGLGMELKVIAAVVIGGGSLNGGRGSVMGTVAGAVMMATIASGCTILGLSNPMQDIIIGMIIVAAVTVDQVRQRNRG